MTEIPEPSAAVEYLAPLNRAFDRMVTALFRPFDLARWCAVGFSCWLARLLSGGPGFGFGGGGGTGRAEAAAWHGTGSGLEDWVLPVALPLVGCIVLAVLGALLALLWLSSRGHFLFLDHVVLDRAAIREPWRRYGRLGDSLFLWRLAFGVAAALALATSLLPLLLFLAPWRQEASPLLLLPAALSAFLFLSVLVTSLYVGLFLVDFVAPIMYREGLGAVAAWRRFGSLFRHRPGPFLLYGLLVLGLWLAVGLAVATVGLATCCLGFLVLLIPYLGTVVLLPVYYTLRAYSLEFLAQFGPGFDAFAPSTGQAQ